MGKFWDKVEEDDREMEVEPRSLPEEIWPVEQLWNKF